MYFEIRNSGIRNSEFGEAGIQNSKFGIRIQNSETGISDTEFGIVIFIDTVAFLRWKFESTEHWNLQFGILKSGIRNSEFGIWNCEFLLTFKIWPRPLVPVDFTVGPNKYNYLNTVRWLIFFGWNRCVTLTFDAIDWPLNFNVPLIQIFSI